MYLVMAYRYGNRTSYNFPVGTFKNFDIAKKAAKDHNVFRGGKYNHVIWHLTPENDYDAEEAKIVFNSCKEY